MMNSQNCLFNVVLVAVVSLSAARSTPQCSAKMTKAGLTERFGVAVSHGVHYLTVEDLQRFNPLVNETNRVPVVNLDLVSEEPILRSAPYAQIVPGGNLKTYGMQLADRVLSNMDRKHFDVAGYGALERVVHALHMTSCWTTTLEEYQKLKHNNASKDVCPCLMDIDNNGVMMALRVVALNLREPMLIHGKANAGYHWRWGTETVALDDPNDNASALPCELKSTADWVKWKDAFLSMKPEDDYELAYYLYCALD